MIFNGKAWKFGDDINTDEIIPARYLNTIDPKVLASHCMEDARADFSKVSEPGDIIVAGKNFGCGSSREHAPICIKAQGISCVIAESFARIFYRNSFNIGLPIFEMKDVGKIKEGDILEVDTEMGKVQNITQKESYKVMPIPKFMQELISCGGLLEYAKQMKKR
jgi:3-isopropylmalate dehydratase small subunit